MTPLRIPACFDPAQTLDCGQAFRWEGSSGGLWEGVAGNRFLRLRREGDFLLLFCSQQEFDSFWGNYFDLDEDYKAKRDRLSKLHPVLAEAAALYPGIRLLRQDPWEALCSFLISQNNNIPRIKGILRTLCRLFGSPIPGTEFFSFPAPQALSPLSPEDLAPLRAGYRTKYLVGAARKVETGEIDLQKIKSSPAAFGREELKKVLGVGPKVAECVLLYGFHKTECFPVDVWIKRAVKAFLPGISPESFGEDAGLIQQYLFHYSRLHPELVIDPLRQGQYQRVGN